MSPVAKSPPEEKLLRTLWNRGPLTRGAAKTDTETVRRLVAINLIEELPPTSKRAAPKLVLTEAGRAAAAKLPPPKPTQLDVFRQVATMREELESLRQFVETHLSTVPAPTKMAQDPPPPVESPMTLRSGDPEPRQVSLEDFGRNVREAVLLLDREERLGGLVPLPRVRDALQGMGLSRAAFDDAVLALEDQYVIDLKVANDPSRLKDGDLGIATHDRGLLYFVVAR
jgi:DNA-binding MarR family transcriptional regulator